MTGGAIELDGALLEADLGDHAAQEAIALGVAAELFDHPTIHEAEIARVARNLDARELRQRPIEEARARALEESVLARAALGIGDVGAVLPRCDEIDGDLGRILQIAVHDDHGVGVCNVDPRRDGDLVALVAGERIHRDAVVALAELAQQRQRAITGSVVDEHELAREAIGEAIRDAAETLIKHRDVVLLVVDGQDEGEGLHRFTAPSTR